MRAFHAAAMLLPMSILAACSANNGNDATAAQGGGSEIVEAADQTSIERLDPALDGIVLPGTRLEKIGSGFEFVEGPIWVDGKLRFSDLVGNKLYEIGDDGQTRMIMDHSGGLTEVPAGMAYPGSNGSVIDQDGSVLMCQHGARQIARVDRDLNVTPFLTGMDGKRFNSPNDLAFAPDGSLWITDPPFGLVAGDDDPAKEAPYNAVYRYANGKLSAVITDLPAPNGIAFSPDGSKLYISNSGPDMYVNVYDVNADGTVSAPRKFISYSGPEDGPGVPDGLKVDSAGNVWTSGPGGIRILSPEGKVLGQIRTTDEAQSNLAWGGPDWKTAYITAATNVYRLQLVIPGEKPLYPAS